MITWDVAAFPKAVDAFLATLQADLAPAPMGARAFGWLEDVALEHGWLIERSSVPPDEHETFLDQVTPFLLFTPSRRILVCRGRDGDRYALVTPTGLRVVGRGELRVELADPHAMGADRWIQSLSPRTQSVARRRLGRAGSSLDGFAFRRRVRGDRDVVSALGLRKHALRIASHSVLQAVLAAASWLAISAVAVDGHADRGRLIAWLALSACAAVVQVVALRRSAELAVRAGSTLRQRLLEGTFDADAATIDGLGIGGLMVLSVQAESLVSTMVAVFVSALGIVGNGIATVVLLSRAPLVGWSFAALGTAIAVLLGLSRRLLRATQELQNTRICTTTDFVERMVGHRTRLVQQTPASWHAGEDDVLSTYAVANARVDRITAHLRLVPRAFVALTLPIVLLVLLRWNDPTSIALVFGGLLVSAFTLGGLADAMILGVQAAVSLDSMRRLAGRSETKSPNADFAEDEAAPQFELRRVSFRYGASRPVLREQSFRIPRGSHVLLEGPSGSGKTTLASLLAGLRRPSSGTLSIDGTDLRFVRDASLRRRVAYAPQFHRNHIFSGALAFNVLLARGWPCGPKELAEAEALLRELGLGPLIDRMPAGIHQQVGESGWQLSHGERSRVFLARALMQTSKALLFDESFGTLDPEAVAQCLAVVRRRAETLVVVTHR